MRSSLWTLRITEVVRITWPGPSGRRFRGRHTRAGMMDFGIVVIRACNRFGARGIECRIDWQRLPLQAQLGR